MRIFSLFWLEFRRLLRSPLTWLIMGLTVLSPVMGLFLYQPTEATTLGIYLANPSLAAGIFSSLLFAFLTVGMESGKTRADGGAPIFNCLSTDCFLHPSVVSYRYRWFSMEYHCSCLDAIYHDGFWKCF